MRISKISRTCRLARIGAALLSLATSSVARAGQLSFLDGGIDGTNGLYGATSVAVSPDGRHVYAAGYSDSAVAFFGRDAATGSLAFIEYVTDGDVGVHGIHSASSVQLSPDGRNVYANGSTDSALVVFAPEPERGPAAASALALLAAAASRSSARRRVLAGPSRSG